MNEKASLVQFYYAFQSIRAFFCLFHAIRTHHWPLGLVFLTSDRVLFHSYSRPFHSFIFVPALSYTTCPSFPFPFLSIFFLLFPFRLTPCFLYLLLFPLPTPFLYSCTLLSLPPFSPLPLSQVIESGPGSSATVAQLEPHTSYGVRIRAISEDGSLGKFSDVLISNKIPKVSEDASLRSE